MAQVRLITLCACERIIEMDDSKGLPVYIRQPLRESFPIDSPLPGDIREMAMTIRVFRFRSVEDMPEYVEQLDERLRKS